MSEKFLFLLITFILGSLFFVRYSQVDKSAVHNLPFMPIFYEGSLAFGSQINREYCVDGVYFSMGEDTYLLRTDTEDFELYKSDVLPTGYISLPLEFPPKDTMYCEALTCECEKYAIVLSGVKESALDTENWLTYSHPVFSIKYPQNTTIEIPNDQVAFTIPKPGGSPSGYHQLTVEIIDNPENLVLEEIVPYYLELKTGEDRKSVSKYIHISDDKIGGEYAMKVIQDGSWWQGSGPKTIHVIPCQDKAILISSQLQEGFMNTTGQFTFSDTVYTPTVQKMLDSFAIVEK